MGRMIHDAIQPKGKCMKEFAWEQLLEVFHNIPCAQPLWSYVVSNWLPKCEMLVMGNCNLPYVG